MSVVDVLRSLAESREHDTVPVQAAMSYGQVREAMAQFAAIACALGGYIDSDLVSLARACADGCKGHDETRETLAETLRQRDAWIRRATLAESARDRLRDELADARQLCNGRCDIAEARMQVGPDGVVPGNARECAQLWIAEASRMRDELRRGDGLRALLRECEQHLLDDVNGNYGTLFDRIAAALGEA